MTPSTVLNRFSGFDDVSLATEAPETAKAVQASYSPDFTPLKQGVNERAAKTGAWQSISHPQKPRCSRASEQIPLISVWVAAGNKGFTQDGKLFRRVVAPNLHNFGSSKLVASFVIRVPDMAFEPLPGDTVAPGGFFELPP